jgi:hypothetical protein
METAVALAPDNRFILRAATRLYTMLRQSDRALHMLRASEATKHDPWLQSAEVATSELAGMHSRFAGAALRKLRGVDRVSQSHSELAMAIATLEERSGAKRRTIQKIIKAALARPTENALAQAVWLLENSGDVLSEKFPGVDIPDEAHEALALDRYERGDLEASEKECSLWVRDQPFQARGPLMLVNINTVHFARYKFAAAIAEQALSIHHDDWNLVNSAVVARAMSGDLEKAEGHLGRLKTLSSADEVAKIFYFAAKGLIAFEGGNVLEGRSNYLSASDLARKINRNDLVVNAAIYYAECELRAKSAPFSEISKFVRTIDELVKKKNLTSGPTLQRIWKSRRRLLVQHVEERRSVSPRAEFPSAGLTSRLVPAQLEN